MEIYESILESLVRKPLTNDQIAYEASIDCRAVSDRLDFLVQNCLVEDRIKADKTVYALTERGVMVLRTLSFKKYLVKVSETLHALDDAIQALPSMSDQNQHARARKQKLNGNY
jgi:predicted transcriptional regulator